MPQGQADYLRYFSDRDSYCLKPHGEHFMLGLKSTSVVLNLLGIDALSISREHV